MNFGSDLWVFLFFRFAIEISLDLKLRPSLKERDERKITNAWRERGLMQFLGTVEITRLECQVPCLFYVWVNSKLSSNLGFKFILGYERGPLILRAIKSLALKSQTSFHWDEVEESNPFYHLLTLIQVLFFIASRVFTQIIRYKMKIHQNFERASEEIYICANFSHLKRVVKFSSSSSSYFSSSN